MTPPSLALPGRPLLTGLSWIRSPLAGCYVVREGASTYLIDAGFPEAAMPIERAFQMAGLPIKSLSQILLTHQHPDHMGGAAYLRYHTGAKVACHAADALAVEGKGPRIAPWLVRVLFSKHPVTVDRVLKDGDTVGPFQVVHVPGHTPGSVAYYHTEKKWLFTGDAVCTPGGEIQLARRFSTFDPDQAIKAVEKLSKLDVAALFPGHGRPLRQDVNARLKAAAEDLGKFTPSKSWVLFGPEGRAETHPGQ